VLFVIDDSPTKRYGPKVEGAGFHHNPTPGPAGEKFLYGHSWVTLGRAVRHPQHGMIGLPLAARLYIREKDLPKIPAGTRPTFQTKLVQAGELLERACLFGTHDEDEVWVVIAKGVGAPSLLHEVASRLKLSHTDLGDAGIGLRGNN
jgi:hypothetical protein